jgi:hypothetical protein
MSSSAAEENTATHTTLIVAIDALGGFGFAAIAIGRLTARSCGAAFA